MKILVAALLGFSPSACDNLRVRSVNIYHDDGPIIFTQIRGYDEKMLKVGPACVQTANCYFNNWIIFCQTNFRNFFAF